LADTASACECVKLIDGNWHLCQHKTIYY